MHYWITAYDDDLSKHSPGMLLLMEVGKAAAEQGIARVELGPGEEPYKARAGSGAGDASDATVCASAAASVMVGATDAFKTWSQGSAAGEWLRSARRRITRGGYRVLSTLGVSG